MRSRYAIELMIQGGTLATEIEEDIRFPLRSDSVWNSVLGEFRTLTLNRHDEIDGLIRICEELSSLPEHRHPNESVAWAEVAALIAKSGDLDRALKLAERALARTLEFHFFEGKTFRSALLTVGECLFREERYMTLANLLLKLIPSVLNERTLSQAARLFEMGGEKGKAIEAYEKAGRCAKAARVSGQTAFDIDEVHLYPEGILHPTAFHHDWIEYWRPAEVLGYFDDYDMDGFLAGSELYIEHHDSWLGAIDCLIRSIGEKKPPRTDYEKALQYHHQAKVKFGLGATTGQLSRIYLGLNDLSRFTRLFLELVGILPHSETYYDGKLFPDLATIVPHAEGSYFDIAKPFLRFLRKHNADDEYRNCLEHIQAALLKQGEVLLCLTLLTEEQQWEQFEKVWRAEDEPEWAAATYARVEMTSEEAKVYEYAKKAGAKLSDGQMEKLAAYYEQEGQHGEAAAAYEEIAASGEPLVVVEEANESQERVVACPKCGQEIEANSKFCIHCGTKLTELSLKCPKCGIILPAGAKFCKECGADV